MKFSFGAFLAGLLTSQVIAVPFAQNHGLIARHDHAAHHRNDKRAAVQPEQSRRSQPCRRDLSFLLDLGLAAIGLNPTHNDGVLPWLGDDGDFTNTFINNGTEDLTLVVWGPAGSWVNVITPHITVSIPAGGSQIVSFPFGSSGAWAPIYRDTTLVNGQISETWGEFTFNEWSTVDVSREVNMNGHNMRIITPKCTTDMTTCVFVCPAGQSVCMNNYQLLNCSIGSQPGANYGEYLGSPAGGCSGMGNAAHLETHLNY